MSKKSIANQFESDLKTKKFFRLKYNEDSYLFETKSYKELQSFVGLLEYCNFKHKTIDYSDVIVKGLFIDNTIKRYSFYTDKLEEELREEHQIPIVTNEVPEYVTKFKSKRVPFG